jgi:hypothetical protein
VIFCWRWKGKIRLVARHLGNLQYNAHFVVVSALVVVALVWDPKDKYAAGAWVRDSWRTL